MRDSTRWRRPPANGGQRSLFGGSIPPRQAVCPTTLPHNQSPTSRAAAKHAAARAPSQAARILEYLQQRGDQGATTDELCEVLGLLPQSGSARVNGLHREGTIRDSGETRAARSGTAAIVWVISRLPARHEGGAMQ
jgi:hypothetical protein